MSKVTANGINRGRPPRPARRDFGRGSAWVRVRLRLLPVLLLLPALQACRPTIGSSLIHPDADKQITFTADRGSVKGTIDQMQIEADGSVVAANLGDSALHTGGPYGSHSNAQLWFAAVAQKPGGSSVRSLDKWVYVADPTYDFTFPPPTGSNSGYPNSTSEQTGANLYRLDKSVVWTHASNAVLEYASASGLTTTEVMTVADNLVAAVAWYVDAHMSWRSDSTNRKVFAKAGWGSYSPGWDFPQPADLTLSISGNLTNGNAKDDFQGDCEDFAILRAALLRRLGFAPWAIWDTIDNPLSHEYNVVLYEGAFRLMDYGTIDRWLDTHTWDAHRSYYGWNQNNGPRGANSTTHNYLVSNTDNYPGGKSDGNVWSYNIYYKDTSP